MPGSSRGLWLTHRKDGQVRQHSLSPAPWPQALWGWPPQWIGLNHLCTWGFLGTQTKGQACSLASSLGAAPIVLGSPLLIKAAILLPSKKRRFQTALTTPAPWETSFRRKKEFGGWKWRYSFWALPLLSKMSFPDCLPCLVLGFHLISH